MKLPRPLLWLMTALLGLVLVSCSTVRKTLNEDTTAEIEFVVSKDVNPDADGRASPLVMRVFKLADQRQFQLETFLTLYEDAGNRLGKDLLDTVNLKEFIPGETRTEKLKLSPEVHFLGLMAEYVQYDTANALLTLPIEPYTNNKFRIYVERLDVLTEDQKRARDKK